MSPKTYGIKPTTSKKNKKKQLQRKRLSKKSESRLFKGVKTTRRQKSAKRLKTMKFIGAIIGAFIVIAVVGIVGFKGFEIIISLKTKDFNNEVTSTKNKVVGFTDVPEYPNSEFVYKNHLDDQEVQELLSEGLSIYRIQDFSTTKEVYEYYKEKLPDFGWSPVQTVKVGNSSKMYGQYWEKENRGLRIYTKSNDLCFQQITAKQANNGLADQVKKEIEQELLVLGASSQDFLPDFPWRLSIPAEYVITYSFTEISDLQSVKLQRLGDNNIIFIAPVAYEGAGTYDFFADKFIQDYLTSSEDSSDDANSSSLKDFQSTSWGVQNSFLIEINEKEALQAKLTSTDRSADLAIVKNDRTTVYYGILATAQDDPFFQFILKNITEPKKED